MQEADTAIVCANLFDLSDASLSSFHPTPISFTFRIAGSVVKSIKENSAVKPPQGIILDAPFNNMLTAAYHSPQGKVRKPILL